MPDSSSMTLRSGGFLVSRLGVGRPRLVELRGRRRRISPLASRSRRWSARLSIASRGCCCRCCVTMSEDSVKVAVRVRPFNTREIERQSKLVIDMQGPMTTIANPEAPNEEPKKFTFDYSYWSHDGFQDDGEGVLMPTSDESHYASQKKVFEDLGQGVLNNAFAGYNCSLFAYGQTGSGKSYSMVGYGKNRGIVPITCDVLFQTMAANKDSNMRYEVTFSMLEIYNEHVRDLLSKDNPKGGLQVHQNPKMGIFYVEGLKKVPVGSYREIEKRMEQGTASRTVASTNMNATSSRAHTVVTITFDQISKDPASGEEKKRSSVMNLVDLAGSERADSTGATGDRLKEGANINKSLSALGNVISALAELSGGTKKKIVVPYRDSVLTKLLQNALGGNSKTIMIAALSPADINYDETLSTLRYADRAKKIKNRAVINENPLDKMIRELKEENERLRKAMLGGGVIQTTVGMSPEEIARMRKEMEEEIRAQLQANLAMMSDTQQSWEERLKEAQKDEAIDDSKDNSQRKLKEAHFVNLNEDPMLSGVIYHFIKPGKTTVGRKDGDYCPDIALSGLSIQKEHAIIEYEGETVVMRPAPNGARTKVNGEPIVGTQVLTHKDRIVFGSSHVYVFMNPLKPDCSPDLPKEITYEFAQKEIARAKGLTAGTAGLNREQQIIQDQILEILPMVSEANAISEDLNKYRFFEVVLMSSSASGTHLGKPSAGSRKIDENRICVMVQVYNLLNDNKWLWERGKFMNRRYIMQEMYQQWMSGEDVSGRTPEEDPFWEPLENVIVGTTNMYLRFLCFPMDFDYQAPVKNYAGQDEGVLSLQIAPCTANGRPLDLDLVSSDAQEPAEAVEELRGKPFYFKINVVSALVEQQRYAKGLTVKYAVLNDTERTSTETIRGTCQPVFNHTRVVQISAMNQDWIDFFLSGYITFELYACQEDMPPDPKLVKMSTRELRQQKQVSQAVQNKRRDTSFGVGGGVVGGEDANTSKLKSDYALLEKKLERLLQKEKRLQQLCDEWAIKSPTERQFDSFYRAVYAVAHSSGVALKARAMVIAKVVGRQKAIEEESTVITPALQSKLASAKDNDLISLHYFGDDEHAIVREVERNGGHAPENVLRKHYGRPSDTDEPPALVQRPGSAQVRVESQMCRMM